MKSRGKETAPGPLPYHLQSFDAEHWRLPGDEHVSPEMAYERQHARWFSARLNALPPSRFTKLNEVRAMVGMPPITDVK